MTGMADLYARALDFPPHPCPTTRYILAATPRSGSTFLALSLWRTGTLGAPLEYLNLENSFSAIFALGDGVVEQYWHRLQQLRTTPNGVFGVKMFPKYFDRVATSSPGTWEDLLSFGKIVLLQRLDRAAQARSLVRAMQTDAWFSSQAPTGTALFDADQLAWATRRIAAENDRWQRLIDQSGVSPLEISYEALVEDGEAVLAAIHAYLGVAPDPTRRLALPLNLAVQRDTQSESWRAKIG